LIYAALPGKLINNYISVSTDIQHNTQEKNMLNQLAEYFHKMFQSFEKPQTYGSALEEYIVRHAPQDGCDVDRLTREFDLKNSNTGWFR
jgi:hypothetical protein